MEEEHSKKEQFWEKYKVLESFKDKTETFPCLLSEQQLKFLTKIYVKWRSHPSSEKEIADSLNTKIKRQALFYKLAQKEL